MSISHIDKLKIFGVCGEGCEILYSLSPNDEKKIQTQEEMLKGCIKACKVIDVYDGDTCTIIFKTHALEKFKFRIYGYDSPEMRVPRSFTDEARKIAKQKAVDAKNALLKFIHEKKTAVKVRGKDKYGRLLGELYAFPEDFNESTECSVANYMITNGHGYPYTGGTKRT